MGNNKINKFYVSMIWQSLAEDPNMDDSFLGLNLANEESLYIVLNNLMKPSFDDFPQFIKERCKNSLAFAINFYDEKLLVRLYESAIPVFNPPDNMDIKQFYVAVWRFLFPEEEFLIKNAGDYIEIAFHDLYKNSM
ncbi:hypothetical protein ACN5L5_002634 [Cronobacter turicensis]